MFEKNENKLKEAGDGPFLKKCELLELIVFVNIFNRNIFLSSVRIEPVVAPITHIKCL